MLKGKDIKNEIKDAMSKMDVVNNPAAVGITYSSVVTSYLMKNTEITCSFTGTNPTSGVVETLPNVKATLVLPPLVLIPAVNGDAFLVNLTLGLKAATAVVDPTAMIPPVLAAPIPLAASTGMIAGCIPTGFNKDTNIDDFVAEMWDNIFKQFKSGFISPVPIPATHAAFVGTVNMVSIK